MRSRGSSRIRKSTILLSIHICANRIFRNERCIRLFAGGGVADENPGKHGQHDQRCMLEARLEGRQPVTATAFEATLPQAVKSAADKLARVLDTQIGRLSRVHANPAPT